MRAIDVPRPKDKLLVNYCIDPWESEKKQPHTLESSAQPFACRTNKSTHGAALNFQTWSNRDAG